MSFQHGEPWKAAESPLHDGEQTKKSRSGIATFNDMYRDALTGNNNLGKGFVLTSQGLHS